MLCNMFLYVVQHILQAPAGSCTKSTDTKSIMRHRRHGERVALRHYLARAAMERMAHRIPGAYSLREQICSAVLRAIKEECPRRSRVPGIRQPYYL